MHSKRLTHVQDSFFNELRRRKLVQTATIYGAVAWGLTEVVVTVTEQLFLPRWVSTLAVIGFIVGFPVMMVPNSVAVLRIAARSSSIAASEQGLGALAVSEKLGVAHLVEAIRQYRQVTQVDPNSTRPRHLIRKGSEYYSRRDATRRWLLWQSSH